VLRSIQSLYGYKILARGDGMGKVHEFLFDDESWTIRYLVADTGSWLPGRRVLIPPVAFGKPDWESKGFPVILTRRQVEDSPGLNKDKPVSRQHEIELFRHYGWPPYWPLAGLSYNPQPTLPPYGEKTGTERESEERDDAGNPHLRSTREVAGYSIAASDGAIGHVDDFIADDDEWLIRYIVIDTRNWLPGRKVILAARWIESVSWDKKEVAINLTRDLIKNSPEYDPKEPVNREYETRLYDYYGRPRYWS